MKNIKIKSQKSKMPTAGLLGFLSIFLSFYLLPAIHADGKNEQVSISTETKVNYGAFYADGLPSKKWVALTFDDGPNPKVLDKLLDTLKKENVKATFFVLGCNVKLCPETVSKYLNNGHEIGNHTYIHKNYYSLKKKKSTDELEKILTEQLITTGDAIQANGGAKPLFMRMPYGFITSSVKKIAKEQKYIVVNWTFGWDWKKTTKKELIEKYVGNVKPGAIFLFHEKQITSEALPEIIEGIKKKGYKIVLLREILEIEANGKW